MSSAITTTGHQAFQKLIASCHRSQQQFMRAAEAICNSDLKRLLRIYSQQRSRFAEELKAHLPGATAEQGSFSQTEELEIERTTPSDAELLRWCLEADAASLREYQHALGSTSPSKTQFLVSAQYSLMQQAHERMQILASKQPGCMIQQSQPNPIAV
jgi:hypothetical protein